MHSNVLSVRNAHVDEELFDLFSVISLDDDLHLLISVIFLLLSVSLSFFFRVLSLLEQTTVCLKVLP